MYSQNKEDEFIAMHFGDFRGRLLDIGANDGITFSNSRLFIERGWSADLVEPSPAAFRALSQCKIMSAIGVSLTYAQHHAIRLHNYAIGETTGEIEWYESDWHATKQDVALLSSSSIAHVDRWRRHKRPDGTFQAFMKTRAYSYRWEDTALKFHDYNYITIDTEGHNLEVVRQLFPIGDTVAETSVSCLCVEWANDPATLAEITKHATAYGLTEARRNYENVIFTV